MDRTAQMIVLNQDFTSFAFSKFEKQITAVIRQLHLPVRRKVLFRLSRR